RRSRARTYICDECEGAVGAARPCDDGDISYKSVPAKHGFDAVEIDAKPAYLDLPVLAADSFQQSIGPLAHEVPGAKDPRSAPIGFNGLVRKTPLRPTSQRNVRACDKKLADFAGGRGMTLFIDYRETVAGQRIADRNAGVVTPAAVVNEPLHHR